MPHRTAYNVDGKAVPVIYEDGDLHLLLSAEILAEWSDSDRLAIMDIFEAYANDLKAIESLRDSLGYEGRSVEPVQRLASRMDWLGDYARETLADHLAVLQRQRREYEERRERKQPDRTPGHVYIVRGGDYHKIGMSGRLTKRLSELGTMPPFELELVHSVQVWHPGKLEASLHERYAEKRQNGEWFVLEPSDIDDAIAVMNAWGNGKGAAQ